MSIPLSRLYSAIDPATLILLADDAETGIADPAILTAALEAATAEVTAHLAGRPFTPLAEHLAVTLAIERLFHRRRELEPAAWRERADRARRILAEIAAGRFPAADAAARIRMRGNTEPTRTARLERLL
jgi:phage gp36-like protein